MSERWLKRTGFICLALLLGLAGCTPAKAPAPTPTPAPPTPTPTPLATLTIEQTTAKLLNVVDFEALHSPVDEDANKGLILGNLAISKPAADLPPELAVFLGRWEGYSYAPPVKKDYKLVLAVQEITALGGKATGWWGMYLQYPALVGETLFRVVQGERPSIEFQLPESDGSLTSVTFSYDQDRDMLVGWGKNPANPSPTGPIELSHERSFTVYKDYAAHLASKNIYAKTYQDSELGHYGNGYLIYLPEGYADHPEKTWPLIFFLHGRGERGDNLFLAVKGSPFNFVREKRSLPFIIAAPLLNLSEEYESFPEAYMDGALAEIRANYRVDPKRIYVTGLSMGGEATYRFAVHQPDTFAAIAPISAFVESETYFMLGLIKHLPVWAVHGADDTIIPLSRGQQPVEALKAAGGNVKFTVLAGHDHDSWTDTYADPAFYDWLLQFQRP
jgi:predicted esterase